MRGGAATAPTADPSDASGAGGQIDFQVFAVGDGASPFDRLSARSILLSTPMASDSSCCTA